MLSPPRGDNCPYTLPGLSDDTTRIHKLLEQLARKPSDSLQLQEEADQLSTNLAERLAQHCPRSFKYIEWVADNSHFQLTRIRLNKLFNENNIVPFNLVLAEGKKQSAFQFVTRSGNIITEQTLPLEFIETMWSLGLTGKAVKLLYSDSEIPVPDYVIPPLGLLTNEVLSWYYDNSVKIGGGTYGEIRKYADDKVVKRSTNVYHGISRSLLVEAVILQKLSHPVIIRLFDVFCSPQEMGLVLPLADGDLKRKFTIPESKDITYQLVHGIAYLHSMDVLHGDLKPANCLFFHEDGKMNVVIADFGVSSTEKRCQVENQEVFTPNYRAPEIELGAPYTKAADIWALGCIAYELITGSVLFAYIDGILDSIFAVLGSPTEDSWPEVYSYPRWRDNYNKYRSPDSTLREPQFAISREFLILNPTERPTANELIRNSLFDEVRVNVHQRISLSSSYKKLQPTLQAIPTSVTPSHKFATYYKMMTSDLASFHLTERTIALTVMLTESILRPRRTVTPLILKINFGEFVFTILNLVSQYYDDLRVTNDTVSESLLVDLKYDILQLTHFNLALTTSYDILIAEANYYPTDVREYAIKLLRVTYFSSISTIFKPREIALFCLYASVLYYNNIWKHDQFSRLRFHDILGEFLTTLPRQIQTDPSVRTALSGSMFDISHIESLHV